MRSRRHQKGSVCERSGVFFLRYYIREEIVEKDKDPEARPDEDLSLVEIGPRFVLDIIRIFEGSFGGPTLFLNEDFVSPNTVSIYMLSCRMSEA